MMTPIVLQAAIDEAAKAQIAHMFDVMFTGFIDEDPNVVAHFKVGLSRVIQAHKAATDAINAL